MKKTLVLALALILFGAGQAKAMDLRALNVQNARIYADDDANTELRVGFDWFQSDGNFVPGLTASTQTANLPRIDIRQACTSCPIPFRIGVNTGLAMGTTELEGANQSEVFERSAFGFSNLGLTLEAAVVQNDAAAVNLYINQHFPWIHNNLLTATTLRPVNGVNAYGFQTGALYQFDMGDHFTWYGDFGYRFDIPQTGVTQHSLVYYNEGVLGLGSNNNFGLSLGLLGNSVYTQNFGTDLRLVPGLIAKVGDSGQLRVGLPFSINGSSTGSGADIGVQASYFTTF